MALTVPVVVTSDRRNLGTVTGADEEAAAAVTVTVATDGTSTGGRDGGGTQGSSGTGSSRARTRGTRGTGLGRGTTRRPLGLGIVQVPELPPLDPASVLMAEPVVPEGKRFCPHCEAKLSREQGVCPECGKPYSFRPALAAGDVVADQYEVLGAMAFGGLGWLYLGKDRLLSRYVVLKGLLNAQDAAGAAAAVAERQFLAAVKHPNIVGVYNFARRGAEGYIVMEFVRGRTLRSLRRERGPLPPAEAIAYVHRILGAFAYLHRQEPPLIYCDFKPENVMLEGDDVKLIDLGAVRRVDDPGGEVFGTQGYLAPEGGAEPSVESDLFTVARTLAVLVTKFRGFRGAYEFTLPPPSEEPLYAQHPSLHRWLLRATRREPETRFGSAEEMAEQLAGVLRGIVAAETGTPRPAESTLFTGEPFAVTGGEEGDDGGGEDGHPDPADLPVGPAAVRRLPGFQLDPTDPAATYLLTNAGSAVVVADPAGVFAAAAEKFAGSLEAPLRLARAHVEAGRGPEAAAALAAAQILVEQKGGDEDAYDWRVGWTRGLVALGTGRAADAVRSFDRVWGELPGELAPPLALALATETTGNEPARAAALYDAVSRTDPSWTLATFGLARCRAALGQRDAATSALGRVPPTSHLYPRAQVALARVLVRDSRPGAEEFRRAAATVAALATTLEAGERHRLAAELLGCALERIEAGELAAAPEVCVFGRPLEADELRRGLESSLRALARLATDRAEKIRWVDLANAVRPPTWW